MIFDKGFHRSACRLVTALLAAMGSGCHFGSGPVPSSTTVVRVNDHRLMASEFSRQLADRLRTYPILTARDSAIVAQAKNAIIQDFIIDSITEDWAKKNQVFVRKERLDEEIARVRSSYPDDVSFRRALAVEGQTYAEWVAKIQAHTLEKAVLETIVKSLPKISEEEVATFYQNNKEKYSRPAQIKLRQIVLDSEISAERIRKELQSGASFSGLAKKFSISPDGRTGGEIEWLEKGAFEAFDPAFNLGVGARSSIIKTPYGFHIFEVVARRPARTIPFDEARANILRKLQERQQNLAYKKWLESELLSAKVFKDEGFIKSIHIETRAE